MVDVPLFPLDQQGSLDLSVINLSQTTSTEAVKQYKKITKKKHIVSLLGTTPGPYSVPNLT
ncbi:hypothetical protein YC2023_052607 [Brassica napus]